MDEVMKRRLIGAVVVVAVAVIVLPMFLGGRQSENRGQKTSRPQSTTRKAESRPSSPPAQSSGSADVKTVTIPLNVSKGESTPHNTVPQPQQSESGSLADSATAPSTPSVNQARQPAPAAAPTGQNSAPPTRSQPQPSAGQSLPSKPAPSSVAQRQPLEAPSKAGNARKTNDNGSPQSGASPAASQQKVASAAAQIPSGNGDWGVQVGSFTDAANANDLAKSLKTKGFSAFVATAQVGNNTFHRVRVGPVASKGDAAKLAQRVESAVGHGVQVLKVR